MQPAPGLTRCQQFPLVASLLAAQGFTPSPLPPEQPLLCSHHLPASEPQLPCSPQNCQAGSSPGAAPGTRLQLSQRSHSAVFCCSVGLQFCGHFFPFHCFVLHGPASGREKLSQQTRFQHFPAEPFLNTELEKSQSRAAQQEGFSAVQGKELLCQLLCNT